VEDAAFWLVKVTAGADGWIAEGRAYETIRLNDVLTVRQSQQQSDIRPKLIVRAISTYGKEVPELGRVHTGALLLQGSGGEMLEDDSYLYRADFRGELAPAK